jgi:hypothetical protein
MHPRFSNKKERDAAFDLVLSALGADASRVETPDWVRNEFEIFLVQVSLGGAYAAGAIIDLTGNKPLPLVSASKLSAACLTIEKSRKLSQLAERIVLTWMSDLASGNPVDSRLRVLIAEWCRQRLGSARRGRPQDSPLKQFAVVTRLIELGGKYPERARSAKKQIYGDLQAGFGLKRSQLIKLIGDFDPWKFIKNKASGKYD